MAVYFHPLPPEDFPAHVQPRIKRFNRELRDVFGLEGALKASRSTVQRSDNTIARRNETNVDVTRVTGLVQDGAPVSQLTQNQIDILDGEANLVWDIGFGPVLSVSDGSSTRFYRLTLTWNSSVTPARPMLSLVEV